MAELTWKQGSSPLLQSGRFDFTAPLSSSAHVYSQNQQKLSGLADAELQMGCFLHAMQFVN